MDLLDPIMAIAEKVYSLCGEVKANKHRSKRLARRVSALTEMVEAVKVHGLGGQPRLVERGLRELKLTLESALDVVKKYASTSCLKRIVRAYDLGDEFAILNERLNDAAHLLSLALAADQKDKLDVVFEEARRRIEDKDDRESDRHELQKLLQVAEETKGSVHAVHDIVDETNRGVKNIEAMLKSLRAPSIHLQDIREIRMEELTFDVPKKPFMTTPTSEVFKGEFSKFTVAIKRYTYPISTSASMVRSIFNKEVETMKRFESPNILRMFGICVQDENGPNPNFLIVMEYCEKGSLKQVLDGNYKLPWDRKSRMCLDAAQGLYRLHQSEEKFKVHGCINSNKFLVAAGYRVKLGGFELAKTETSLRKNNSGKFSTLCYSSPQQLQSINHPYDKACEIYSFGIVLWEIATRCAPFKGCDQKFVYQKVCEEKAMEPLPEDCPRQLGELIDACRCYDDFQRPTAGVLVDKLRKVVEQLEED
ncbi:mixed lineage kinase domain-like protein isoform X2 [Alosa sapidissima]|nr:mixed lineage kinase domain-like protein isoform X2 [Alosa sapidissima]XP_041966904.1 mixed lineage kinase domain-like protein isoform X2 [Alosa sapidissima]XP_041966905.1 mixed lineage kinase domain-like protein isoform X2 [Alosa sapidissima]